MNSTLVIVLVIQWVFLLGLALILLGAVRQIGVLHQRIAPAGALTMSHGVKAGQRVPELRLQSLDGEVMSVGGPDRDGLATLIVFVAPDCPVCAALLPAVKAIARQESTWLRVLFASDGDAPLHAQFRREKGLTDYPYFVSMELGLTFQVGKLPYAVLLDKEGTLLAQGLANSREHLESLFEAKRLRVASIQDYLNQGGAGRALEVKAGGGLG